MTKRDLINALEAAPIPDDGHVFVLCDQVATLMGSPCSNQLGIQSIETVDAWRGGRVNLAIRVHEHNGRIRPREAAYSVESPDLKPNAFERALAGRRIDLMTTNEVRELLEDGI